jgi:apolipoprotein N-acyltransferase
MERDAAASFAARMGLAGLAGAAVLASTPPLHLDGLAFVAFPLLLLALERALERALPGGSPSLKRPSSFGSGFVVGCVTGFVANAIALNSTVSLITEFGGLPMPVALLASALLWLWQALPYALAAETAALLATRGVRMALSLPLGFVVWQTITPTLFPWRPGCLASALPLFTQVAEFGGEPLLDLCIALGPIALLEALRSRSLRFAAVAAVFGAGPFLYGALRLPAVRAERAAATSIRVGIVQPSVSVPDKRNPALREERLLALHELTARAEAAGADVVVWPETAYPYRIRRTRKHDFRGGQQILARGVHGPLLLGAVTEDAGNRSYNSALALDRNGNFQGIADKVNLLAFGEYVPLWDLLPPLQERFARGHYAGERPVALDLAGVRYGILNCYEDLLSGFVRDVMPLGPEILINVTNDAWFGDTNEPFLHQTVARVRAVETRRDLIRSVNTGVSSHTLSTGEDVARTETWTRTWFASDAKRLGGITPWVRFGDWVTPAAFACLLALMGRALWTRRARERSAPQTSSATASP